MASVLLTMVIDLIITITIAMKLIKEQSHVVSIRESPGFVKGPSWLHQSGERGDTFQKVPSGSSLAYICMQLPHQWNY